ncbi:MAG: repeat domain protein [Gemmatimonadetes bacterium]|nr:repeat domain protein [Gemmatimonadota bacterium]
MSDATLAPTSGPDAVPVKAAPAPASSYLQHLPAIYQLNAGEQPNFLGRFLLAFEEVLTGAPDGGGGGLEGRIAGLRTLFDPEVVPADFMEWLAGWVALGLRSDLGLEERRAFLRSAVPLYRRRGTKLGLESAIRIHTQYAHAAPGGPPAPAEAQPEVTVEEAAPEMRVGERTRVGETTVIGGGPPHFFRVRIWDPCLDAASLRRTREVVAAVIELEKPAHTVYTLQVEGPTMQIGVRSTVGRDTLITREIARPASTRTAHG